MCSPHLARGYIASDEVNREKFVVNPFYNDIHHQHQTAPDDGDEDDEAKGGDDDNDKGTRKRGDSGALDAPLPVLPRLRDRLYRTGDLGRYMSSGDAECSGRADDQIKIRGFRVELGEINAFLSRHPLARENVTILREDRPGDKQVGARFGRGRAGVMEWLG